MVKHLDRSGHEGLRQRRTRAGRTTLAAALVVGVLMVAGAPTSAATATPKDTEAFARLGDCATPVEGVACHYVSAVAQMHFVQLEFTTTELQDGTEVFLSDVLCNVDQAKVRLGHGPGDGQVEYTSRVPAADCDFSMGETPADLDVSFVWTGTGPFITGNNDCSVIGTIGGTSAGEPLFCTVLVTSHGP